ncbi:MAG: TIM barrel protein [Acidobacteria bacterium]|nr:TIM barrel protein [Acidobacteriota bacterium]
MTRRLFLTAAALQPLKTRFHFGFTPDSFAILRPQRTALEFLERVHSMGAGGAQATLPPNADAAYLKQVRSFVETNNLYWELLLPLPQDDTTAFETAVKAAKEAGAESIRSVCLSGRRYETFNSLDQWNDFVRTSHRRISLAVPVAEKYKLPLGLENHKDWTAEEMPALFRQYSSEYFGACIDFGNNVSLLDSPMELIEALAPYVINTHIKDMAVEEYADGFLLSEVPLGAGLVDLPKAIALLRSKRPQVKFSLDMLTRDPLKIPCLTEKYWVTFTQRHARHLARSLATVRANKPKAPLPRVTGLSRDEALALEARILDQCLAWARQNI